MKLISHRGNIIGPNPTRENKPSYVDTAISAGYEVEIDVYYLNDKFYLGHDTPDYEVNDKWITLRKNSLWIHCKNLDAATKLQKMGNSYNYFCHNLDEYVLCSNGHTWVHDLTLNIGKTTIIPLLSDIDILNYEGGVPYGICTDYISLAEYELKQKGIYK